MNKANKNYTYYESTKNGNQQKCHDPIINNKQHNNNDNDIYDTNNKNIENNNRSDITKSDKTTLDTNNETPSNLTNNREHSRSIAVPYTNSHLPSPLYFK